MHIPINNLLLATFLVLFSAVCYAESGDRDKPLQIESDQATIDDASKTSTFTGNVKLIQGSMQIHADKFVVSQDEDGFKRGIAYGKTASFKQKIEGTDEFIEGYGERIEYDTRSEVVNFFIRAQIKRGMDELRGEHITYNVETEIFQVNSNNADSAGNPPQRVRAILHPKPKVGSPSAAEPNMHIEKPNSYPATDSLP